MQRICDVHQRSVSEATWKLQRFSHPVGPYSAEILDMQLDEGAVRAVR